MIGSVVLRGAWMGWDTADSVRDVALIRPGLSRATFPPGEGSANAVQTWYHVPLIDHKKAFPEGEGGCEADE